MRKFTMFMDWQLHFVKWKAKATVDVFDVADALEKYGGSFMKAIWTALRRADCVNQAKIVNCRPMEIDEIVNLFILENKNDE